MTILSNMNTQQKAELLDAIIASGGASNTQITAVQDDIADQLSTIQDIITNQISLVRSAMATVATRSALAAKTDRTGIIALTEGLRSGLFAFVSTNMSAEVAADPEQAFYIAPSSDVTGATGAWVRAHTQPRTANLGWFGLVVGSTSANEIALTAAFNWLNQARNSTLLIPPGTWGFTSDKRILQSGCTLLGSNAGCTLRPEGTGVARIIIGYADESIVVSGTRIDKGAPGNVKPIETTFKWVNVLAVGARNGEVVLVDLADNTKFEDCSFGHTAGSTTTACIGVKTHWAQWTYFTRCTINVNWIGVYIRLQPTNTQNEDHFHFVNCQIYCGKTGPATVNMPGPNGVVVEGATPVATMPCNILIHKEAGNSYGIFEFKVDGCHLGRFGTSYPMSSIAIRSDNPGDTRSIHTGKIIGTFFEYSDYAIDFHRYNTVYGTGGTDTSKLDVSGCSFLQNNVCFNGSSVSKNKVTSTGNYFLQGTSVAVGTTVQFVGQNSVEGFSNAFPSGVMRMRFMDRWNKDNCLQYVLAKSGQITVPAGSTYIDVTHGLDFAPGIASIICNNHHGSSWVTSYAVSGVDATKFRVYFGTPPSVDRTLSWSAMVDYI